MRDEILRPALDLFGIDQKGIPISTYLTSPLVVAVRTTEPR
jgi:hypothetical protein